MELLHFAVVSELPSSVLGFSEVTKVSAAVQKQIMRDVSPVWNINATVDPFQKLEDVPLGYWPIIVRDDIEYDGAEGIHLDDDGQPFSLVRMSRGWSLTCSHEALEMLVDPFGDKLKQGKSPKEDQGKVLFLVEVCDPSEARQYSYTVNGIVVSDFYTPNYFDPMKTTGVKYSYTGAIEKPRDVLDGGYLSWKDPVSGRWWQWVKFDGTADGQFVDIGRIDASAGHSLRTAIDMATTGRYEHLAKTDDRISALVAARASQNENPSNAKAKTLRTQIDKLVRKPVSV
ncbi:MAG: hypothetical protein QG574_5420 [Cyanobacteriota bacterium erpe_2018_sw_21hr_WHONDRS-SW48-000092_B_bin.40]|jgi:hypothetical protein|nr:hypothetical protein [Cyanobacteriota bacterium erpe_2018_sw_21hr_WHONDRS-SW48-000092_B_bin.40]